MRIRDVPSRLPASRQERLGCADDLFPRFVITVLPAGISGQIIAGLLGEAMNPSSSESAQRARA